MKLLILESPNKKKTVSQFLSKDYVVEASIGHITKLKDDGLYNLGIDVRGDFGAQYVIDDKKKDTVKKLKELVKRAEEIIIFTDPDREGEDIAWHLKEELNIPIKKLKRCTAHEITKKAVEEALSKPRKIDMDLVHAAEARSKLDKIVGYRLSPVARSKISARSVGRCQSPALKLVVEREEEILNFDPKTYYEIWLPFVKDKVDYKAQYKGLIKDKKNTPTLDNKEDAETICKNCNGRDYIVKDIVSSDRAVSPKAPFITSTLQQEASSKLGYSVKRTMQIAQDLFAGIQVCGQHVGLISYIRTDCDDLPEEIITAVHNKLDEDYGKDMFREPKKGKKSKNAQEGHSAIYAVDISMTPEKLEALVNDKAMVRLYRLIYNRTLKACCKPAIVTDTTYIIDNSGYRYEYSEHAIKEKGFYAIDTTDNEDEVVQKSINLWVGEKLEIIK